MKHFVFGTDNLNQKYGIKKKKINHFNMMLILENYYYLCKKLNNF